MNGIDTLTDDPLAQSMYEIPTQSLQTNYHTEDKFTKNDELRKQEEYLQYLQNKQKIIEMENHLNSTFSHPSSSKAPIEYDLRQGQKVPTKSGITTSTIGGSSKVINSSVTTGVKKEITPTNTANPAKTKVDASKVSRMLAGQPAPTKK